MKKLYLVIGLFFVLVCISPCLAQRDASQMQRQQELLEQNAAMREQIETPQKVFVKTIKIEGADLLSEDEIKQVILPFQKQWLSKEDIRQIIDSLGQAYEKKGKGQPPEISSQLKEDTLILRFGNEKTGGK